MSKHINKVEAVPETYGCQGCCFFAIENMPICKQLDCEGVIHKPVKQFIINHNKNKTDGNH